MTHVILQHCCNDAACVDVCPVDCIHPRPDEAGFATAEMLFIDPAVCIDCGACADVCPVDAAMADYDLPPHAQGFIALNRAFFDERTEPSPALEHKRMPPVGPGQSTEQFAVAIIGTGPAGCYAAEDLLKRAGTDVRIDMFERLPVPGGLARFGVAPDHLATKAISRRFDKVFDDPRVGLHLGVNIGRDVTHEDLASAYDAVIYAVGTFADRPLGIPGEELPGSCSAADIVAWYNGHPEFCEHAFDLGVEAAAIIGNGNVALDIARILVKDPDRLHRSDIAAHALDALRESAIREVAILARRGPLQAAFTLPELLGLRDDPDIGLWTDLPEALTADMLLESAGGPQTWSARRKLDTVLDLPRSAPETGRSVRLSFFRVPRRILGNGRAEGLMLEQVSPDAAGEIVERAGLIIRAAGFRGREIAGVPFNPASGTIPHAGGRVLDAENGATVPGTYATGWIKRGASGAMGTNRQCAKETIDALLDDRLAAAALDAAKRSDRPRLVMPRHGTVAHWRAIDRLERANGAAMGRPRLKFVREEDMWRAAQETSE